MPLAVQIRTVVVSSSRMRSSTISWRSADASSSMGSRTSEALSEGTRCLLTEAAAALLALFTPVSTPVDFKNQAPTARPADSTATPTHIIGRPTENCFLDTFPPRARLEGPPLAQLLFFRQGRTPT